ncbi:MAG: hypothetical protein NTY47_01945, partial [Candidatus Omnitrophica bacterium]|nr:hypothetical protein [Candidatus Omnitrophota bacterium]
YFLPNNFFTILVVNLFKLAAERGIPCALVKSGVSTLWVDYCLDKMRGADKPDSELTDQERLYRKLIITPRELKLSGYEGGKNPEFEGAAYVTIQEGDIRLVNHDFSTYTTEVGFKFVSELLLGLMDPKAQRMLGGVKVRLVVGFEESAGFGFGVDVLDEYGNLIRRYLIPDKDGLTAGVLMFALQAHLGKSLYQLYEEAKEEFDPALHNERQDVAASTGVKVRIINGLLDTCQAPAVVPQELKVRALAIIDYFKAIGGERTHIGGICYDRFNIMTVDEQGMPVIFRARMSGTEPICRIYIEASTEKVRTEVRELVDEWILACNLYEIRNTPDIFSLFDLLSVIRSILPCFGEKQVFRAHRMVLRFLIVLIF